MSESASTNFPFDTPGSEITVDYRPLESRRIRRARLEAAEVAMELNTANPPIGAPIMKPQRFGVVFSDEDRAARMDQGLL